jgi:hypothetical protein
MQTLAEKVNFYLENRIHENKTELCTTMTRCGSDKGSRHNYATFYNYIFGERRHEKGFRLFEVGLGTNNPHLPSSMGINGVPGASLRGFREFFTNGKMYGADVDKNCLFNEERIATFYVNQLEPESIVNLWKTHFGGVQFDLIIDDGLHAFEANRNFLENSFHMLKSGGLFIIEDVDFEYEDKIRNLDLSKLNGVDESVFLRIPINSDIQRNNQLLVVSKK